MNNVIEFHSLAKSHTSNIKFCISTKFTEIDDCFRGSACWRALNWSIQSCNCPELGESDKTLYINGDDYEEDDRVLVTNGSNFIFYNTLRTLVNFREARIYNAV